MSSVFTGACVSHGAQTREVVTCAKCRLVQYVTSTGACRRCKHFPDPSPPPLESEVPVEETEEPREATCRIRLPIGRIRRSRGMTQRQMAQKMGFHQTHISKLETFRTTPTLATLLKIAEALEVSIISLLGEEPRLRSFVQDAFVSEMATLVPFISVDQRKSVLNRMAAMLRRQPRKALRNQKTEQHETEQP